MGLFEILLIFRKLLLDTIKPHTNVFLLALHLFELLLHFGPLQLHSRMLILKLLVKGLLERSQKVVIRRKKSHGVLFFEILGVLLMIFLSVHIFRFYKNTTAIDHNLHIN